MTKNKLYLLLIVLLAAGYAYLSLAFIWQHEQNHDVVACPVKALTGIPCPSCGSTRSVMAIINGNFTEGLLLNPLGYIVATVMLILPIWLIFDMALGKATLLKAYRELETTLRKKWVAVPLILLVLANWIWNITKGL